MLTSHFYSFILFRTADHNLALQSYISNMFNNPNSTLDRLKDEAARQYEQINKDDPPSSSSPSSYPPPSHHHHPSAQSIYEEKLEKLVREDLARLESHMKRLGIVINCYSSFINLLIRFFNGRRSSEKIKRVDSIGRPKNKIIRGSAKGMYHCSLSNNNHSLIIND